MDGQLLIDKPRGWSSFDVIRKLQVVFAAPHATSSTSSGQARNTQHTGNSRKHLPKMGHAGTLDPMATGLLIVLLGSACKQQDRFMKLDKEYEAEIRLGATSDTDDAEGTITSSPETSLGTGKQPIRQAQGRQAESSKIKKDTEQPTLEKVQKVLERFTGEIEQVPPQYSAVKVKGKRAYQTARAGGKTELKPRLVTVHSLEVAEYAYPVLKITCSVSSGTYIRSLARDIGQTLGTGGYLSSLRRTRIGDYSVDQAVTPEAPPVTLISHIKPY